MIGKVSDGWVGGWIGGGGYVVVVVVKRQEMIRKKVESC